MKGIPGRLLAAAVLTIAADYLLFGHAAGCGVTTFAAVVLAATALRYGRRLGRSWWWLALWMAVALGASLDYSRMGAALLVVLLWAIIAQAVLPAGKDIFEAVCGGVAGGLKGLAGVVYDVFGRRRISAAGETARYAPAWVIVLPAAIIAIFAVLIIPANLVVSQWVTTGLRTLGEWIREIDAWRVGFWLVVGLEAYGLFVFRPWWRRRGRARKAGSSFVPPPPPPPGARVKANYPTAEMRRGYQVAAAVTTFAGLNLIYLAANAADATYLWFALKLPEGLTYAGFAHAGSYRLLAAVVLAAATVTAFFRVGSPAGQSAKARWLVYLFVAQNAAVLVGAARRLELYVEAYGLTRFRVAAFVWMVLVMGGYAFLAWKLARSRKFHFLLKTNTALTLVVLSAVSLADVDGFIARWNVAQWEQGVHKDIDVAYLGRLGATAMPSVARLAVSDDRAVAERAQGVLGRVMAREEGRRAPWQSRTLRSGRALEETRSVMGIVDSGEPEEAEVL